MRKLNTQTKWRILIAAVIVFGFLSVIFPIERTNPPVTGEIKAPEEVMAILRRSCYDCHSNETQWPWYSYVAPASWLVEKDVRDGRRHMNFSEWSSHSSKEKNHQRKKCGKLVKQGEMPLWFYVALHPKAELLDKDIETLILWSIDTQHKE